MAERAPIRDLVERFARHHEAIEILREVSALRDEITVKAFLDKLKVFDHPAYNEIKEPERREPRSLQNHPLNPPRVR